MENCSIDSANKEQQSAYELIRDTNSCIFITGKAGTGKTTFIQRIQNEIHKNFVILAPTGSAAIKAGGQTIHSFFGFPMEAIGPKTELHVSFQNESLLKHIDTIIIDEVSMMRCDMVDGMDRYLRLALNNNMPFGGKQIVFVGDLFQLPPVVREKGADADMLHDNYGPGKPFFYKANVLKRMNLPKIEFQKVYRQTDHAFVELLNKIRVGELSEAEINILNEHVASSDNMDDYSVILTGRNRKADRINEKKLIALENDEVTYDGIKFGDFKSGDCPVPEHLRLKVGAQVIFCRNDYDTKCANGTIATVIRLDDDVIQVRLENGNTANVVRATWESYERTYNRKTRKIESNIVGSFNQFPLKLAWAVTIHRSQGMTFERMHLDTSGGIFTPGQIYVAISRMRSLSGLTLGKRLEAKHFTVNPEIKAFSNSFNDIEMIDDELNSGREFYCHFKKGQFDKASYALLNTALYKVQNKDYRNAALTAKKMFDIMLDDDHLLGETANIPLIKSDNIICNFLNSVICLYGNRYDDAIGYADLVLSRKNCFEAMYIKARANYAKGNFKETADIISQMIALSNEEEEKRAIDKKMYLLEIKASAKIGNSIIELCKKLLEICPTCIDAYLFLRNELIKNKQIKAENDLSESELLNSFNNPDISEAEFAIILQNTDMKSDMFKQFQKNLLRIKHTL